MPDIESEDPHLIVRNAEFVQTSSLLVIVAPVGGVEHKRLLKSVLFRSSRRYHLRLCRIRRRHLHMDTQTGNSQWPRNLK